MCLPWNPPGLIFTHKYKDVIPAKAGIQILSRIETLDILEFCPVFPML